MKQLLSKVLLVFLALAILVLLVPSNEAQVGSSITQVSTMPSGLKFAVDGQVFTQTMGAIWPAGSKHTLFAQIIQYDTLGGTQYTFQNWQWSGGVLPGGNQIAVTADPSIPSYQAVYTIAYALNLQFSPCPVGTCPSPGTVYVNGVPFAHDTTVFVGAGSSAVLQAFPGTG
jgi:hypothetical protein